MVRIILTDIDNSKHTFENITSFRVEKERFTPYTSADVTFISDILSTQYKDISIYVNDFCVHFGLIDTLECCQKSDMITVKISSKSFTSLLIQNQPVPGMIYKVSLNSLMNDFVDIPNIQYENNDTVQNYIFLKDNCDLWDAVVNISYKIYGIYPYVRQSNYIRISIDEDVSDFSQLPDFITSRGVCLDYTKMVSDYHMQDIEGNYDSYSLKNQEAVLRNIIRHKQIPLDRQYLNNPEESMRNKLLFSMRGHHTEYIEYSGYRGEDILDYSDEKRIDKIIIKGSAYGIKTTLHNYIEIAL